MIGGFSKVLIGTSNYLTSLGISTVVSQLNIFRPVIVKANNQFINEIEIHEPSAVILEIDNLNEPFTKQLKHIKSGTHINTLAITRASRKYDIDKLVESGFQSIVAANCDRDEFIRAVHSLAKGERFLSNQIIELLLSKEPDEAVESEVAISSREIEVLQLIAEGLKTQEIADHLHVSIHTINSHRKNMLKKLGLKSPIELIVYALEHDLINK